MEERVFVCCRHVDAGRAHGGESVWEETKVKKTNGSVDTKAATALIYWNACGEQAYIMRQNLRTNLRLRVWSTLTMVVAPVDAGGGGRGGDLDEV